MKKIIEIANGPSREELFDGLRLCSEKRLIPFCIKTGEKERFLAVIISSIQAEDGSGHSWNLTFYTNQLLVSEEIFSQKQDIHVLAKEVSFEFFKQLTEEDYLLNQFKINQIMFEGYYSTKTRKGNITLK